MEKDKRPDESAETIVKNAEKEDVVENRPDNTPASSSPRIGMRPRIITVTYKPIPRFTGGCKNC